MMTTRILSTSARAAFTLLGLSLATVPVSGGVVFSESFESPVVNGYASNTVPSGGTWIGSAGTFGSDNRGPYNEAFAWPATAPFTTPYGAQAYYINYGGAGLTTAVGATGQTLTAGVTYKVGFNVAVAAGTVSGTYQVELVAFGAADDNTTRTNLQSGRPGTILGSATGTVTTTTMATAASIVFTPVAGNAHLGKDLGIRIVRATNSVLYDNIRLVVGHDMNPSPASGVTVASGNVPLSWTNMPATTGTDVYVDVWFGTNPAALTKVVNGTLNTSSTTVTAPSAGTYYWRVDSYLNGSATGIPVTGDLFVFHVIDTDNDGLPDTYEAANTTPSSNIALNTGDDLDGDGLNNLQEYTYGTGPRNPDTDGDTLLDGPEINGTAGSRPATNPLLADSDADGFGDGVETNTGIWVSAANTGTNPVDADWDNDGLKDGVEKKTGIFVSRTTDTGTDPYLTDTDNDGAGDWYEVAATFTSPNSAAEKSPIPYPLPDPDGSTGTTNKPVKVYIMSGQSNMVGIGYVTGTKPGSLETIAKRENKFPNLVTAGNAWTARNDVLYRGVVTAIGNAPLTAGQGSSSTTLGPELGFGHVMGWYHGEPVLLIKASQGNRGLFWDILPPGSPSLGHTDGYTYAGYGQGPNKWLTAGGAPTPYVWYAGKQYDDFFLAESDMGPIAWADATSYAAGVYIRHNGVIYTSKSAHTASAASEPGVGAQTATYWTVYSVFNVTDVLDNFATQYPQYAAQGFEIAGYVWFQGNWDIGSDLATNRYETNLTQFIKQVRTYYAGRYPGKCSTTTPLVLATGCGDPGTSGRGLTVANAQLAMNDPAKHPEFDGNVKTMDTRGYWRSLAESPGAQGYHYNNNAETYMLTGDALGRAMISLQNDITPPSPDPSVFAIAPTAVNATTVGMAATPAVDVSGPVHYYFENTSNGNFRDWSTDPSWNNTGLTNAVSYNFRFKARDNKGNETGWSAVLSAAPGNDVTAPLPDPMTFAAPPAAQGENSISMAATTATDINGVQYFFDCTSGGGPDSGWQDSPVYTAIGLAPATQYTYVVLARDKSSGLNPTAASAPASATTAAPDTAPPAPNPMTFATPPVAQGENSITMTATTANDVSGVQYFFDCTSAGGHDSGWQDSPTYTDTGLTAETQYTYQVQARDKSPALNATTASAPASATTDAPDVAPPVVLSLSPADNAIEVAVAANLLVIFDEEITADSGFITLKNLSDATQTAISINDPQVIISGNVLTINPATNLIPGKNYAVRIDATAFQDLAGNQFPGITDDTTWNFTAAVVPYVWTQTAGGAQPWTTDTNWQGGNVPSPITGDTMDFSTVNIAADTSLTLGADRSAQLWKFGDTGSNQNWTVTTGNQIILAGTTPTIQVNQNTATLNNIVAGTSGLTKTGGGTLVLSNTANTYSGGTTINGGTLVPSVAALGGSTTITFTGNGILQSVYNSNPTFTQGVAINSSVTGHLNAANQYYHMTVSGVLSGTGTLLIGGTDNSNGNVTLSNTGNSYTGIIRIGNTTRAGNLFTANIADGVGAGAIQLGGTTGAGNLTFSGTSAAQAFTDRVFTLSGSTGGGTITNNGATANIVTISQNLAITGTGNKTLTLGGSNTGNNTFAGDIPTGPGASVIGLTKAGAGKWILSGNNAYTGATTISAGTLGINSIADYGASSTLGSPASGAITMGSGSSTATLLYAGSGHSSNRSIQIGDATAANTGGSTLTNNGSGALTFTAANFNPTITGITATRILTLGGSYSGGSNQIQGIIQDNVASTGKVAVTKANDASTWILSGVNTYTGTTTVSGGKLFINGDQTAAIGNVSVSANATLGGTGIIGGATTIAATGKLEFNLSTNAASHDKLELAATKALTFSGASVLTITSSGGASIGNYTLVTAPGGISGVAPATLILPANWVATVSKVGNDLVLNVTSTGVASDPYTTWAVGGVAFDADTNGDGVKNGMAWLLGAANPSANATDKLPQASRNGGHLRLTFRCLKSTNRGTAQLKVQSSNDLGASDPWTLHEAAVPDADGTVNGVIFDTTADADPAYINVTADIPAAGTKLYARLVATQ